MDCKIVQKNGDFHMLIVYAAVIINLLIIRFMPKHVSKLEIYVTFLMLVALNTLTDVVIAVILDLFDYGPDGKVGVGEFIAEIFISPTFGIIFMNFMPRDLKKYLLYLAGWVAFSLGFEWLTVKSNYMTYKGWTLWYSAVAYVVIFLLIRWNLGFIRKQTA